MDMCALDMPRCRRKGLAKAISVDQTHCAPSAPIASNGRERAKGGLCSSMRWAGGVAAAVRRGEDGRGRACWSHLIAQSSGAVPRGCGEVRTMRPLPLFPGSSRRGGGPSAHVLTHHHPLACHHEHEYRTRRAGVWLRTALAAGLSSMRVLPRVSQPTLDSFRKDVYRPRLALLLLILLLAARDPGQTDAADGTSRSSTQQTINRLALSATAPAISSVDAPPFKPFLSRLRLPFLASRSSTEGAQASDSSSTEAQAGQGSHKHDHKSVTQARRSSTVPPPLSTAVFHLPKLSIRLLLLEGEALSAIVPLHILWIVRLGGMMVEDSIVRVSVYAGLSSSSCSDGRMHSNHLRGLACPALPHTDSSWQRFLA